MDGSWSEIEQRHNMTFSWGSSFQDAFDAVQNGGPGTAAIMGIGYGGGGARTWWRWSTRTAPSAIVEGQDWGNSDPREVITDSNRANERYNGDGASNIGWGLVGAGAPPP